MIIIILLLCYIIILFFYYHDLPLYLLQVTTDFLLSTTAGCFLSKDVTDTGFDGVVQVTVIGKHTGVLPIIDSSCSAFNIPSLSSISSPTDFNSEFGKECICNVFVGHAVKEDMSSMAGICMNSQKENAFSNNSAIDHHSALSIDPLMEYSVSSTVCSGGRNYNEVVSGVSKDTLAKVNVDGKCEDIDGNGDLSQVSRHDVALLAEDISADLTELILNDSLTESILNDSLTESILNDSLTESILNDSLTNVDDITAKEHLATDFSQVEAITFPPTVGLECSFPSEHLNGSPTNDDAACNAFQRHISPNACTPAPPTAIEQPVSPMVHLPKLSAKAKQITVAIGDNGMAKQQMIDEAASVMVHGLLVDAVSYMTCIRRRHQCRDEGSGGLVEQEAACSLDIILSGEAMFTSDTTVGLIRPAVPNGAFSDDVSVLNSCRKHASDNQDQSISPYFECCAGLPAERDFFGKKRDLTVLHVGADAEDEVSVADTNERQLTHTYIYVNTWIQHLVMCVCLFVGSGLLNDVVLLSGG